jgi:hypothetical protein
MHILRCSFVSTVFCCPDDQQQTSRWQQKQGEKRNGHPMLCVPPSLPPQVPIALTAHHIHGVEMR